METIKLCPNCNGLGLLVENMTVKCILLDKYKSHVLDSEQWNICANPGCEITYFTEKGKKFTKSDVKVKVWYKEVTNDTPICYCSNLTRGEIINAMKNGCKTISEVQKYTNKNITGKCRFKNPLGKCCRNVFMSSMADFRV